ncbi:hypothetical protein [Lichenibacterium dinghuense]|uniref:hypothetical protein n=1 Tax=Lichenibacterium dinghuense TaxID=2895977 RepID=UPI001F2FF6C0|nr:hypothetical protein [Lichenibacterium sp. 6Y81]
MLDGSIRRALASLALGVGLLSSEAARAEAPCPAVPALTVRRYAGRVGHYIADLKTSFAEHELYSPATAITRANYRAVLDGLLNGAGVNGVRLPIVPAYGAEADYPPLYRDTYAYARGLGLTIYASPMSVGMKPFVGWSDDRYASWIAGYAAAFRPDVLSPFNEAGLDNRRIARITGLVRAKLTVPVLLMGPDRQHVARSAESLARDPAVAALFDIVGSHNADRDESATAPAWEALVAAANGRPVWSSENPALWSRGQVDGLPGMDQAVEGGVEGVVAWMAKPGLVDGTGRPTAKACEIAAGLLR